MSVLSTEEKLRAQFSANMAKHNAKPTRHSDEKEHSQIQVNKIDPNPFQPRLQFDEAELNALAESIRTEGLIQPISVRQQGSRYEIVQGERRYRAHKLLGLPSIESMVVDISDEQMAVQSLIENFSRDDLSDYEFSRAIKNIEEKFKTRTGLSEALGINRQDIYRYLSFFDLPESIIERLNETPSLIGRSACYQIKAVMEKHKDNENLEATLIIATDKIKAGELDQTKASAFVDSALSEKKQAVVKESSQSMIQHGKKKLGSFVKTEKQIIVKLKTKNMSEDQQSRLLDFLQSLAQE